MSIEHSTNFRRVDERVTTSGVVDAECLAGLGDEGYDVVINLMPDDSSHAVSGEAAIVAGQGVTYVPIPVDFAEPSRADLDAFFAAMDANAGKQIHVHCAVNARVSVFYGLYAMRQGRWSAEESDALIRGIWDPADYPAWEVFIAEERLRLA